MPAEPQHIRDYYREKFASDLRQFMPCSDVPYFGHNWHLGCRELERVPAANRAKFLVCLYITVLVDQAAHFHYRHLYDRFSAVTRYPKFCHGLGQFQKNPRQLLDAPVDSGRIAASELASVIPDGMRLFVEEVVSFSADHMPEIDPRAFFEKLLYDPDVQIPLLVVVVNPAIKESPAWKAYEALRIAVTAAFPEIR